MRRHRFGGWVEAAEDKNDIERKYAHSLARGMELDSRPDFEEIVEFFETMPADLSDVEDGRPGLTAGTRGQAPAAEIQDYSDLDGDASEEALDHYFESNLEDSTDLVQFQFDAPTLVHGNEVEKYGVETEQEVLETKLADGDLKINVDRNHLEIHERTGRDEYEQLFRDAVPYHTADMEEDGKYLVSMEDDPEIGYNNGVLTIEAPLSYEPLGPEEERTKVY